MRMLHKRWCLSSTFLGTQARSGWLNDGTIGCFEALNSLTAEHILWGAAGGFVHCQQKYCLNKGNIGHLHCLWLAILGYFSFDALGGECFANWCEVVWDRQWIRLPINLLISIPAILVIQWYLPELPYLVVCMIWLTNSKLGSLVSSVTTHLDFASFPQYPGGLGLATNLHVITRSVIMTRLCSKDRPRVWCIVVLL